jgi:hypothetical protein
MGERRKEVRAIERVAVQPIMYRPSTLTLTQSSPHRRETL